MELKFILIVTFSMCSSTLTWAQPNGYLINQDFTPNIAWDNVAYIIPNGSSVHNTTLNTGIDYPSGVLIYTINHNGFAGYDFEIQIQNSETCYVNGKNHIKLDGNGNGPAVYKISAGSYIEGSNLQCIIDISLIKFRK